MYIWIYMYTYICIYTSWSRSRTSAVRPPFGLSRKIGFPCGHSEIQFGHEFPNIDLDQARINFRMGSSWSLEQCSEMHSIYICIIYTVNILNFMTLNFAEAPPGNASLRNFIFATLYNWKVVRSEMPCLRNMQFGIFEFENSDPIWAYKSTRSLWGIGTISDFDSTRKASLRNFVFAALYLESRLLINAQSAKCQVS